MMMWCAWWATRSNAEKSFGLDFGPSVEERCGLVDDFFRRDWAKSCLQTVYWIASWSKQFWWGKKGRPFCFTHSSQPYIEAVEQAFGSDIDHTDTRMLRLCHLPVVLAHYNLINLFDLLTFSLRLRAYLLGDLPCSPEIQLQTELGK